jgi:hypothetical protein
VSRASRLLFLTTLATDRCGTKGLGDDLFGAILAQPVLVQALVLSSHEKTYFGLL